MRVRLTLVVGAIGAAIAVVAGGASAAFPGTNGQIAFMSNRDGNGQIYSMLPDGTAQTRLSNTPDVDSEPTWSADGGSIAFRRDFDIYRMDASGGSQVAIVADAAATDLQPAWAPGGAKLVFTRFLAAGTAQLFTTNVDGTGIDQLTSTTGFNVDPMWSPNGASVVATSSRDGNEEIYDIPADGSTPTRLTNDPGRDFAPAWSPDGSRIAFASTRDGDDEIFVMNADGSSPTQLTSDNGSDTGPAWSPDGNQIVFASDRDGDYEIFVMNADGAGVTQLTSNGADDRFPDWQPLSAGDTTAPTLTLPPNQTVNATSPSGAVVSYAASATDDTDPSPTVSCSPGSGSTFAAGTAVVACTATDASGNSATGSFTVTVVGGSQQLVQLVRELLSASTLPPAVTRLLVSAVQNFNPNNPRQLRAACLALGLLEGFLRRSPDPRATGWLVDAGRIRAVLGC